MIDKVMEFFFDEPTKKDKRFMTFVFYGICIIAIQNIIFAFIR